MPQDPNRSPLCTALDSIPETALVPAHFLAGGSIGARIAYGRESSVMVAVRQPRYHSRPHRHDAEQLNVVLEGELLVFVDEDGFLARKGDVFRIPRNAVHWSWVQGMVPCVLLEMHTPPLIGDAGVLDTAAALLGEEESREGIVAVASEWPSLSRQDTIERAVMERRDVSAETLPGDAPATAAVSAATSSSGDSAASQRFRGNVASHRLGAG